MPALESTRLGRYELLQELGRGAMGVVYKGRDPDIDRFVAIKTISCPTQDDDDYHNYRERFFLEARAAGRLSHPGIVQIFDIGEQPETGDPYIVMELVAGQPLSRMIGKGNKVELGLALRIVQEAAEALAYAHGQGVIHRDIKPANLLITDAGQVKIADFGVAKVDFATLTMPGLFVGTPAYMAPEQLGDAQVDGRADLFSLGVILYCMLTGHRPFQGHGASTIAFKVAHREHLAASALNLELSPEIDHVLARAMAKEPADRYQSGTEMAQDIQDVREGRRPCSGSNTREDSTDTASTSNTTLIARICAITDAEFTGGSAAAQMPLPLAASPKRRVSRTAYIPVALVVFVLALGGFAAHRLLAHPALPPEAALPAAPAASAALTSAPAQTVQPAARKQKNDAAKTTARDSNKPALANRNSAGTASDSTELNAHASVRTAGEVRPAKTAAAPRPLAAAYKIPLKLDIKHPFDEATVSMWVDHELVYSDKIRGEVKKRMLVFRGIKGAHATTIEVPSGEHYLRVRVQANGFDQTQVAVFKGGRGQMLLVKCDKRNNKLELNLQQ